MKWKLVEREKLKDYKMNILLTGCSKGVGLNTLKFLLDKEHTVYGVSRTVNEELISLKIKYPDQFKHIVFDLANSEDIHKKMFVENKLNKVKLDAFVNNAAIAYDDIITNFKLDPIYEMFKVNVFSPFIITKYVIRNMILNKKFGSIVHISSISVHTGYKGLSSYASTKGALEAFSKNTAREWGEKGLRSNCIVAGFMETEMSSTLSSEMKSRIFNRTSLKRPTTLNSVSETILFLISEGSKSITGQNINVDSGTI
jgi:3-oxoacyl-[acyl-carrier protein] reductase